MKRLRWQILIVGVALVAIAVLLFGRQTDIRVIIPQGAEGGVYIEALVGAPSRFNPLLDDFNQADKDINRLVYSGMVKFDSWGNPLPDLAQSWAVNVTGDVFNVTLRENVLWHDGEPLTAEDIVFTIELMRDPEMPVGEDLVALWESVEVIAFDEYNLQFRLEEPFSPFVDYLAFGVIPKHVFEGKSAGQIINDPINLAPIGSGPYKYDELILEDKQVVGVVLSANEDYFLERPKIDQIIFRYYGSTRDALTAYQNGEVMGINSIDLETLNDVLNEPKLNVYSARMPQISMVILNLQNTDLQFFQDIEVRKAMMLGLNREWIVEKALGGQGVIAHSPVLPGNWAYSNGIDIYAYNPDEAVKRLRAAGYALPAKGGQVRQKDDVRLAFELAYVDTPENTVIAEMISADWDKIGIRAKLLPVAPDLFISDVLDPRQFDAVLVDFSMLGTPDPDPYPFWHQSQVSGGQNYSQWNDRRASEYLEQARTTPNREARARLYRNFQVHFSRELPALPLFYPIYNYAVDAEILGLQLSPLYDPSDRFVDILNWYLVSKPGIEKETKETQAP